MSFKPTRVVVIGAGASGLMCARQLDHWRYKVVVLEARVRLGAWSWVCVLIVAGPCGRAGQHNVVRSADGRARRYGHHWLRLWVAVLGRTCDAEWRSGGNPVRVLCKQTDAEPVMVRSYCPIYDADGKLVPVEVDTWLEQEVWLLTSISLLTCMHQFNMILSATKNIANSAVVQETGTPLSLADAFDLTINKHVRTYCCSVCCGLTRGDARQCGGTEGALAEDIVAASGSDPQCRGMVTDVILLRVALVCRPSLRSRRVASHRHAPCPPRSL